MKMDNILNVEEAKTRLIYELSIITGFKYLKSGVLKKTIKDIVFEINADLRLIYKKYGKLRSIYELQSNRWILV